MPRRRKAVPVDEAEAWQAESFGRISARAQEREAIASAPSQWGFEHLATRPIEKLATGAASAKEPLYVMKAAAKGAGRIDRAKPTQRAVSAFASSWDSSTTERQV